MIKKIFYIALFTIIGMTTDVWAWNGSGTEDDPYQIASVSDMKELSSNVRNDNRYEGVYFVLTNDITFSHTTAWNNFNSTENNFLPIGGVTSDLMNHYFMGVFDGQGHTISGLRVCLNNQDTSMPNYYAALFGFVLDGVIKNVRLSDCLFSGYQSCGSIAGTLRGNSRVENCHVDANVAVNCIYTAGTYFCGGLVGLNYGTVDGCTTAATVTSTNEGESPFCNGDFGGIVGKCYGNIYNSIYLGSVVNCSERKGSITSYAGMNEDLTYVKNCYYTNSELTIPAVGPSEMFDPSPAIQENVGLARTLTLGDGISISNDAKRFDTFTGFPSLIVYGEDAISFNGTLYSVAGASITLQYDGPLTDGKSPVLLIDGEENEAIEYLGGNRYLLTMMNANITISVGTGTEEPMWQGSGTADAPFIITTTDELDLLSSMVNRGIDYAGCYFELANDLEYVSTDDNFYDNYKPIGKIRDDGQGYYYFRGSFDGKGNIIKGIRLLKDDTVSDQSNVFMGVFGLIGEGSVVKNLVVEDCNFLGWSYLGGIAGYSMGGTIENCHVTNDVTVRGIVDESIMVGGIVGSNEEGTVEGCTSAAQVTFAENGAVDTHEYYGGIIGYNDGRVNDCVYTGEEVDDIDDSEHSNGAVLGANAENGVATNCYFTFYDERWFNKAIGGTNTASSATNVGRAFTLTLDEYVALKDEPTTYTDLAVVPTVTAYGNYALELNGIYYSTNGATVEVRGSDDLPHGFTATFKAYDAENAEVAMTQGDNTGSFTMPESNVRITAEADYTLTDFDTGSGTEADPYIIYNIYDMNLLATKVNAGNTYANTYFQLADDLTYDGTENNYIPVGYGAGYTKYFAGVFEGNGHTVSGINVNTENGRQGLFGVVNGGTIKNVMMDDCSFIVGDGSGAIVGNLRGDGTVENCHVGSGVVVGASKRTVVHGGVVGNNYFGTVKACSSGAAITSNGFTDSQSFGGIVGTNGSGMAETTSRIENCLYYGTSVDNISGSGAIVGLESTSSQSVVEYSNNYYTNSELKGVNGVDVTADDGAVLAYEKPFAMGAMGSVVAVYGDGTDYADRSMTVYEHGLLYGGKYYSADKYLSLVEDDSEMSAGNKNTDLLSDNAGQTVSMTLDGRTLYKDDTWNTLCLPFDMSLDEGVLIGATVMELDADGTSLTDGILTLAFKPAATLQAGMPYLIKWSEGENIVSPYFEGMLISKVTPLDVVSADGNVTFKGNYSSVAFAADDPHTIFIGANNRLNYPQGGSTLKAFRASFLLNQSAGEVKSFVMTFTNGDATGIDALRNEGTEIQNDGWYDMSGRRLNGQPTVPGIYINGGKKVMVK